MNEIDMYFLDRCGFTPVEGQTYSIGVMRPDFDGYILNVTYKGFGVVKNSKRGRFGCRSRKFFTTKIM